MGDTEFSSGRWYTNDAKVLVRYQTFSADNELERSAFEKESLNEDVGELEEKNIESSIKGFA